MSKAVILKTDVPEYEIQTWPSDDSLSWLQEKVHGFIEVVTLGAYQKALRGLNLALVVNDTGLIDDLPLNPIASVLYGFEIHGQAVLCKTGYVDGEPDIVPLDDLDLDLVQWLLRQI